jgi:hypothetical protein
MAMRKRESDMSGKVAAESVVQLLQSLGETEEEVARSLDWAGVRGVQRDMANCPVACFLRVIGGYDRWLESLTVTSTTVKIVTRPWWRQRMLVPLPPAVRAFVTAFDKGLFQNLVLRTGFDWETPAAGQMNDEPAVPQEDKILAPAAMS